MLGEPLAGPTYAVPNVECIHQMVGHDDTLAVFVGFGDATVHYVPKSVVSEDSEVLTPGDRGTLVLLESEARSRGWVEEDKTSGAREARQLADAVAERRLDKLPLTLPGARTALSLTFQIWSEQDVVVLEDASLPVMTLRFREWVEEELTAIARECLPDKSPKVEPDRVTVDPSDADAVRTAVTSGLPVFLGWGAPTTDAAADSPSTEIRPGGDSLPGDYVEDSPDGLRTLRRADGTPLVVVATSALADKLGAYTIESRPGDRAEVGPDGLTTVRRESGQPVVTVATTGLPKEHGRSINGVCQDCGALASWYADCRPEDYAKNRGLTSAATAALHKPRACVRTDSRDSTMVEHTGDASCPVCNPPRTSDAGQCPWCTACYSTRGELLRHLDAVGRHEGARLVLAEARVHDLESRVAALQAVVDAYGRDGHSVVVRAGDEGEVDVWSDGHAHAFAPLSTVRALREELAAEQQKLTDFAEEMDRQHADCEDKREAAETKLRAELSDALRGLDHALERAASAESQLAREDGNWTGTP